jgi:predicted Zn-dependent peptidase
MAIKVYTLSNGLRVVLRPESYGSAYMTLVTRAGSRFERPEELGISHIFEHLCVRNPKIHYEVESLGEGLSKAETDAEDVSYLFSFPKRNVLKGVKTFARLWMAPLSIEDFENERTVIGIEYVGANENPEDVLDDLFLRTAWQGHPLGMNDTVPWQRNLSNLTFEQFSAFRQRVNCGRNTVLAVAGEVPVQPFLEVLERTLGTLPEGEILSVERHPLLAREGFTVIKQAGALEQVHCLLGFPLPYLRSAEHRALEVLNLYLGDPNLFSSVLYRRVCKELSLVYYLESEIETYYDSGSLVVKWICSPVNLETVLNVILEEIGKIAREEISLGEFRRVRQIYSLQKEGQLDEPTTISVALAEEMIRSGRVSNPKLWPKQARRVRRSEVNRLVQNYLDPQQAVLVLYGPVENLEPRILV